MDLGNAGKRVYFVAQRFLYRHQPGLSQILVLARTKKPYSGARIGPFSRSDARKEKFPALLHRVMIVRAASSGSALYGPELALFPRAQVQEAQAHPSPAGEDRRRPPLVHGPFIVVPASPASGRTRFTIPSYASIRPL